MREIQGLMFGLLMFWLGFLYRFGDIAEMYVKGLMAWIIIFLIIIMMELRDRSEDI